MKKNILYISLLLTSLMACKKAKDLPEAEPAAIKVTQLDPNTFIFENVTPTGGAGSLWNFGGLTTSSKYKDTVFFGTPDTYTVTLTSNSKGGFTSTSTTVTVTESSPYSDFTITQLNGDPNRFVVKADVETNLSYLFEHANGESSTNKSDTVYLPWQGPQEFRLTVKANRNGRVVSSLKKQIVNVASDDASNPQLTDDVMIKLTGGAANTNGKTWVMSPTPGKSGVGPYLPNAMSFAYYDYPAKDGGYVGNSAWVNGALQNEYTFTMRNTIYTPKNNYMTAHWAFANVYFGTNQAQYADIALADPKHAKAPFVLKNEGVGITGYTLKFGYGSYIAYFDARYDYEIAKIKEDSLWIRHKYSDGPQDDPAKDGNQRVLLFTVK